MRIVFSICVVLLSSFLVDACTSGPECPTIPCDTIIKGPNGLNCERYAATVPGICNNGTCVDAGDFSQCTGMGGASIESCGSASCVVSGSCIEGELVADYSSSKVFCVKDGTSTSACMAPQVCDATGTCTAASSTAASSTAASTTAAATTTGAATTSGASCSPAPPCFVDGTCAAECSNVNGCVPSSGTCATQIDCTQVVKGWNGEVCERYGSARDGLCLQNDGCAAADDYALCKSGVGAGAPDGVAIAGASCSVECQKGCAEGTLVSGITGKADVCFLGGENGACPCGQSCNANGVCEGIINDPTKGCMPNPQWTATCNVRGTNQDPNIRGTIDFSGLADGKVDVTVAVIGISVNPDSPHAIHIHEFGDLRNLDGTANGGHWAGAGTQHGCEMDAGRHYGDMGSFTAANGEISESKTFQELGDLIRLEGTHSIIGRSVVIHADPDSCMGAAGDAGARIAHCVIGLASVVEAEATQVAKATEGLTEAVCVFEGTLKCNEYIDQTLDECQPGAIGYAWLSKQGATTVRVSARIEGLLTKQEYGFHIHTYGHLSTTGAQTGGHYNPDGNLHKLPPAVDRHMGDLGSFGTPNDETWLDLTPNVGFYDAVHDNIDMDKIIGRAIVLHSGADNGEGEFCSQSGSSGERVLQCVIGRRNTGIAVDPISTMVSFPNDWAPRACPPPAPPPTKAVPDSQTWSPDQSELSFNQLAAWRASGACSDESGVCEDRSFTAKLKEVLTFTFPTRNSAGQLINLVDSSNLKKEPELDIHALTTASVPDVNGPTATSVERAHCKLHGTDNDGTIIGDVTFTTQANGDVEVVVTASGVTVNASNPHALHVHEFGDLRFQTDGTSTGGHWVGEGTRVHACAPDANRHRGDLGSVSVTGGSISATVSSELLALKGEWSVIGRGVVLHALVDSCDGAVGNAGARLGTCVVGIAKHDTTTELQTAAAKSGFDHAVAVLHGTSNCEANVVVRAPYGSAAEACRRGNVGTVYFKKETDGVLVRAVINGLDEAKVYGIHIHEAGDLTLADGTSAMGHWNPSGASHDLPPAAMRHMGDLGNLDTFDAGVAYYELKHANIDFDTIVGRAIIVHLGPDSGSGAGCDAKGGAGGRLYAGVIGVANLVKEAFPAAFSVTPTVSWTPSPCMRKRDAHALAVFADDAEARAEAREARQAAAITAEWRKRDVFGPIKPYRASYVEGQLSKPFELTADGTYYLTFVADGVVVPPAAIKVVVSGECEDGEPDCPCTPGGACVAGYECRSNVCRVGAGGTTQMAVDPTDNIGGDDSLLGLGLPDMAVYGGGGGILALILICCVIAYCAFAKRDGGASKAERNYWAASGQGAEMNGFAGATFSTPSAYEEASTPSPLSTPTWGSSTTAEPARPVPRPTGGASAGPPTLSRLGPRPNTLQGGAPSGAPLPPRPPGAPGSNGPPSQPPRPPGGAPPRAAAPPRPQGAPPPPLLQTNNW